MGVKLPTSGAVPDLSSIQAKVMAQAQAISAALAQKNAQAAAETSHRNSDAHEKNSAEVDKNKLKSLVDKIPTERYLTFFIIVYYDRFL